MLRYRGENKKERVAFIIDVILKHCKNIGWTKGKRTHGLYNWCYFETLKKYWVNKRRKNIYVYRQKVNICQNIARGTTDPEIDSVTCISCKFGHQVTPLVLVAYLTTKWHNLDWFKIWSSGGATCIVCKVATKLHNFRCHIALDCPISIIS